MNCEALSTHSWRPLIDHRSMSIHIDRLCVWTQLKGVSKRTADWRPVVLSDTDGPSMMSIDEEKLCYRDIVDGSVDIDWRPVDSVETPLDSLPFQHLVCPLDSLPSRSVSVSASCLSCSYHDMTWRTPSVILSRMSSLNIC
jgi:hypothetical protein